MKQRRVGNWLMLGALSAFLFGSALAWWAVSKSIGNFADFLKGDVTAEQIKVQVRQITDNEAVAFYWTLFSLPAAILLFIAGLVIRLCASKQKLNKGIA